MFDQLVKEIDGLTYDEQVILSLYYVDYLSRQEVSEIMDLPLNQIQNSIQDAKKVRSCSNLIIGKEKKTMNKKTGILIVSLAALLGCTPKQKEEATIRTTVDVQVVDDLTASNHSSSESSIIIKKQGNITDIS